MILPNSDLNAVPPTTNSRPKSHQAVADELDLRMDDPFTRVFIAAMYWRALAMHYKAMMDTGTAVNNNVTL